MGEAPPSDPLDPVADQDVRIEWFFAASHAASGTCASPKPACPEALRGQSPDSIGAAMPADSRPSAPNHSSPEIDRRYWQGRYEAGTTGWDRGGASPALQDWLRAGSLVPCRILVPGCGRGHEVVALARAGFHVTGVDYAPAAIETLKTRLDAEGLSAETIEADIFAWETPSPFDAIYEQTSLCALPPGRWEEYEQRLASWLVPGGLLAAAFMQTESPSGPPFACSPEAMRRLFASARWEWPTELIPLPHPLGLVELVGILRRRKS